MHSSVRGENSIRVIDGRGIGIVAEIIPGPWIANFHWGCSGPLEAGQIVAHDLRIIPRQMSLMQFSSAISVFVIACTRDGIDVHNVRGRGDIWPRTSVGTSEVC